MYVPYPFIMQNKFGPATKLESDQTSALMHLNSYVCCFLSFLSLGISNNFISMQFVYIAHNRMLSF